MSNVTVEEIGAFTAEVFGLPEAALTHPAVRLRAGAKGPRDVPVGQALNIAAWLARRHTSASYPTIARAFGRRDHSSLVTGAAAIEATVASDTALRAVVERIEGLIDACHEERLAALTHQPSNANGNPALTRPVIEDHKAGSAGLCAFGAGVAAAADHARKATA